MYIRNMEHYFDLILYQTRHCLDVVRARHVECWLVVVDNLQNSLR